MTWQPNPISPAPAPDPVAPAPPRHLARAAWPWLREFILLALLAAILWVWTAEQRRIYMPGYGEPDCDGYVVLAKRIAHFGPLAITDPDPFLYQTHVWVQGPRGDVLPKFAPGYPLILAAFYRAGGDQAMFLANPVLGALTLVGLFFLVRHWSSAPVALAAAALMLANPMFIFYSGYLLAHTAETCFTVWGMLFLFLWLDAPAPSRRAWLWAVGAGLCLGFAAMVRHTAATLALAVLIALIAKSIQRWRAPRLDPAAAPPAPKQRGQEPFCEAPVGPFRQRFLTPLLPLLPLAAAYALFPLLLMAYNWRYFGGPFTTGYDLTGEQLRFDAEHLRQFWSHLLDHLPVLNGGLLNDLAFLLFPIGLLGIVGFGTLPHRLIKAAWFFPAYLVYLGYYWAPPGMGYYRFLIPAIPLLIGAGLALIHHLKLPWPGRAAAVLVVALFTVLASDRLFAQMIGIDLLADLRPAPSVPAGRTPPRPTPAPPHANQASEPLVQAARRTDVLLADDAVLFVAEPVENFLGTRRNYRLYALSAFSPARMRDFQQTLRSRGGSEPLMQPARYERFYEFYRTASAAQLRQKQAQLVADYVKQGRQVVFLIPRSDLSNQQWRLGPQWELRPLAEWTERQWSPYGGVNWGLYQAHPKPPATQLTTPGQ